MMLWEIEYKVLIYRLHTVRPYNIEASLHHKQR